MKFVNKIFTLVILVGLCLALYAWTPSLGYVDIVFLKYKIYMDIYILIGVLGVLFFILNITFSIYRWFKKHFSSQNITVTKNSINELARCIALNGIGTFNVDNVFDVCKQALSVRNGVSISRKTGISEIDIYNTKLFLNNGISTKALKIDSIITVATSVINEYPAHVSLLKEELLRVAIEAKRAGKRFKFDPSSSKYKLQQEFIDTFDIKMGLTDIELTADVQHKIKILDRLNNKYTNNLEIMEKLLSILAINTGNEEKILRLITEIFKIRPNRKLVTNFLQACASKTYSEVSLLDIALELLKPIANDNVEKLWFLLTVATKSRNYQKIVEYFKNLHSNRENHVALCTFYVDNYAILSAEPEIISLLCK